MESERNYGSCGLSNRFCVSSQIKQTSLTVSINASDRHSPYKRDLI